jgi:hypothetical protein
VPTEQLTDSLTLVVPPIITGASGTLRTLACLDGVSNYHRPFKCACVHYPTSYLTWAVEFLEAIRSVNPPGKWKILVVDEHAQKLLGSVLKQFDILEENVTRASPARCSISRNSAPRSD